MKAKFLLAEVNLDTLKRKEKKFIENSLKRQNNILFLESKKIESIQLKLQIHIGGSVQYIHTYELKTALCLV